MRKSIPLLVVGLLCFVALPAFSQSILVWDKDHNKTFTDPEGAGLVDPTYGITKALDDNGYAHTVSLTLPWDLTTYDIIFVISGIYC